MLLLSKNDYKRVQQVKLMTYDYMWKILVYGSYLDVNLIKRLKESYQSLNDTIQQKAQGIQITRSGKKSVKHYVGKPQILTEQIEPFYVRETDQKWKAQLVHRDREKNKEIFEAPSLLISKGANRTSEMRAGILHKDALFTDSITAVKCDNMDNLYNILGLLYSDFTKYYLFNTASSMGIEREQIHNVEKFSVPFVSNPDIVTTVKKLEQYQREQIPNLDLMHTSLLYYGRHVPEISYETLMNHLNNAIYQQLHLNDEELSLIDYSLEIMMPWIMEKEHSKIYEKLSINDSVITDYLSVFLTHYSLIYKEMNKFFQAQVFYNQDAIGVYFKILESEPSNSIEWINKPEIQSFIHLGSHQELSNLFVQKDIKGFEEDGFYVIKPNEYRYWHKAISYLDFYEFRNAILRTKD